MRKLPGALLWTAVAAAGAWAYFTLARHKGESVNSIYVLIAAICTYTIGYRFYSKWLAARVLALNDRRATPCEVHDDGKDFVKTNRWVVFGHHFAAIAGPGPLVGPVLAAQFGYLPGTLWILIGVVLGGAVQDFVVLFASIRRNGKSLGQMVKDELNSVAGYIALIAILGIMIILLAVLGLVVVSALADSPWGVFTVGATIPIAMFMGGYMRFVRIGKVLEASAMGVVMLLIAVWGGRHVSMNANLAAVFSLKADHLAWAIIAYGLAASVLPVWLLLAPRDYLSTFMKLGTIFALALGVLFVLPDLKMPAITKFTDGSGLVVAGKLFPFCFITIACGSVSGFHALIASGTTPKIITRESYARPIGYGAMCLESLVAIMAIIAACSLDPGVYLSMNVKGAGTEPTAIAADTVLKVQNAGFTVSTEQMQLLADEVQEKSLYGRTGGAATLAVGMAQIFSNVTQGRWLGHWYHFAIMFEALFILTTLDAGTRVGRYLLQDMLGGVWKPLGDTRDVRANVLASVLIVSGWGYFLIQGVRDPLGGINSLWPLFGIANQLLAGIALCLATTVVLKMQLSETPKTKIQTPEKFQTPSSNRGRPVLALVALIPLVWLLAVTMTAGWQKIFDSDPRIGFLAAANSAELAARHNLLEFELASAQTNGESTKVAATERALHTMETLRFNNILDAVVAGFFLVLVAAIVVVSVFEWVSLLARRKPAKLRESEVVWLPSYAVVESKPVQVVGVIALGCALAKELSGEAHLERAQRVAMECTCQQNRSDSVDLLGQRKVVCDRNVGRIYVEALEQHSRVNRCC